MPPESLFQFLQSQMSPAQSLSTRTAHDSIDSLMEPLEPSKPEDGGLLGLIRNLAFNVASRSGGAGYMEENPLQLMKMALTPLKEDELRYTGGEALFAEEPPEGMVGLEWANTAGRPNVDLLSLFLKQKSPSEAGLSEQPLRPTKISKGFKELPTYSIKHETTQRPLSSFTWGDEALSKIANLKKGEVVKMKQTQVGIHPKMDLADYTVSAGKDEKGTYVSLYDVWDFGKGYAEKYQHNKQWMKNPLSFLQAPLMQMIGNPFAVYDRYYIPQSEIKSELSSRQAAGTP